MADFNQAIYKVLKHEGGYVNDPDDPGGATNYGVSLRYLRALNKIKNDALIGDIDNDGDIDVHDIQEMTKDDAIKIYKEYWWLPNRYGEIESQKLATKVFDLAVNMGARRSNRLLQAACDEYANPYILRVDGIIGDQTLHLVNDLNDSYLLDFYKDHAERFYRNLVKRNKRLEKYLKGWLNRVHA